MKIAAKNKGLTLVEILVAAIIMVYCLSTLLGFFVNNVTLNENSRNTAVAASHAQFILEDVRNTVYATAVTRLDANYWTYATPSAISALGLSPLNSESITTVKSGAAPEIVTVTVTWNDTHTRARSFTVATRIGGA